MQDNSHSKIEHRTFVAGELLPLQLNSFWLLQQGIVKTIAYTNEENPITLGYWGKDDLIGQPLLLVYPCRVKCLTYVEAMSCPVAQAGNMTKLIVKYTQQTEELLSILHSEKIYQRLRKMLIWLARKFGTEVEIGQLIDMRLTHQDLAEIIGATRVSVTKLINQLEQEGFLSRPERNTIVVH